MCCEMKYIVELFVYEYSRVLKGKAWEGFKNVTSFFNCNMAKCPNCIVVAG